MLKFFKFALPKPSLTSVVLAGIGGTLGIGALALLDGNLDLAFVMAPFGATCVLLFSVPAAPLSQPVNVLFGHFASALVGLICLTLLQDTFWSLGLAVGLAIAAMAALRVTHPPAGANPIVVFALQPDWLFLLFPVATGALLLIIVAIGYHRFTGLKYPNLPD
ncbi:MAG: HPP family protein [Cognatishimia sp.]|uniref:HPP family protein n=1 Tax=Cognatishimia sp. TaxID=2211648 RepID=UPI003B8AF552